MAEPRRRLDRWTLGILIGVLVLVVAAIVVVVGPVRTATGDESTPRGVVVIYLQAVRSGNPERAYEYLTTPVKNRVTLASFTQQTNFNTSRQRVEVGEATITGDTARVQVSYGDSDVLWGGGSYTRTAVLMLENGRWRISVPTEPFLPQEPIR